MNRRYLHSVVMALAFGAASFGNLGITSADLITQYLFDNEFVDSGNEKSNPNFVEQGFTASAYDSRSSSVGGSLFMGVETVSQEAAYSTLTLMTEGLEPAGDNYHVLQIDVDQGSWNFTELTFDYRLDGILSVFEYSVAVYSDRVGYNGLPDLLGTASVTGIDGSSAPVNVSVDLGNLSQFQNLGAGDSAEFRIYFSGDNDGGLGFHYVDNLQITANAVPEPGQAIIWIVALTVFGCRGGRRRRS